ncbi:hypothetical protein [Flavobacterium pedocola]
MSKPESNRIALLVLQLRYSSPNGDEVTRYYGILFIFNLFIELSLKQHGLGKKR